MKEQRQAPARLGSPDDPVRWPDEAGAYLGIPGPTLAKKRQDGDAPRLYAVGRALFTTRQDLIEWVRSHEVAPGFRARPPVQRKRVAA
jgi:hypothetical protein